MRTGWLRSSAVDPLTFWFRFTARLRRGFSCVRALRDFFSTADSMVGNAAHRAHCAVWCGLCVCVSH